MVAEGEGPVWADMYVIWVVVAREAKPVELLQGEARTGRRMAEVVATSIPEASNTYYHG